MFVGFGVFQGMRAYVRLSSDRLGESRVAFNHLPCETTLAMPMNRVVRTGNGGSIPHRVR
jgi:hypothetical protein